MSSSNQPIWMHLSADGKWEGGMRARLQVRDFEPIYSDEPLRLVDRTVRPTRWSCCWQH